MECPNCTAEADWLEEIEPYWWACAWCGHAWNSLETISEEMPETATSEVE